MKPCSFPTNCPHEAVVTVRIGGIGDRSVCQAHLDWLRTSGMDFRELEVNAYIARWRERDLARDMTGMREPAL